MIIAHELDGFRRQVEDCIASAYSKGYKRGVADVRGELIRCKDCKHRDPEDKKCDCGHGIVWQLPRGDNWYCGDGQRKEDTAQ